MAGGSRIFLPGVMAYGATQEEAKANAEAIALRVLADKIEESKKVSLRCIRLSKWPSSKVPSEY
jgi:predicted RNase H-like HicB family nuclease